MSFPRSIRWKLQLWHGLLLAAVTAGLLVSFWQYQKSQRLAATDTALQGALLYAIPVFAPVRQRPPDAPPPPRPQEEEDARRRREVLDRMEREAIHYAVWRNTGTRMVQTFGPQNIPVPEEAPPGSETAWRMREGVRELIHSGPRGSLIVLGTSITGMTQSLRTLAWQLTAAGAGVVTVALLIGAWITRRALRPIHDISRAAADIAGGQLSRRIDMEEAESELGQLASVLNTTFDRLQQNIEQQVRFTADASHELRTPLSVILSKTQLALRTERSPEEYRETLATCERAARRMKDLVHSLLELARLDGGAAPLESRPCDLAAIAREAVDEMQPLAAAHTLRCAGAESLTVHGDAGRLRQVIVNLAGNAIQHTPPGSSVTVTCEARGTSALLHVQDNGPGIPPEAKAHLFERFFRVDKARTRAAGGSGLGLAIAHSIVTAHSGEISVESPTEGGVLFTVRLPAAGPTAS